MKCIGYHGTDKKNIGNILKNGYIISGDKEWLGKGVYFFETLSPLTYGDQEAINWAKFVKKIQKWAVFKAVIDSNKYIDLVLNIKHREIYDKIKLKLLKKHEKKGKNPLFFNDNIVYKAMEKALNIDFIRALVNAAQTGIYIKTIRRPQVQICVKNTDSIIKNELFKKEN